MTSSPASAAGRSIPFLVVAGVLVAALSLRGPIVAPTPVLRDISIDLGLSSAAAGLLTTAPVLMFALLTPVAALVIRRAGAELALLMSLSGVLLGTVIRALPGFGSMLAGMVVIGAAITIGNVVVPVIIRRDVPPERVGFVTAAYTAMLNAGSLVTSLLTAPLASAIGWSAALLAWSLLTIGGVVLWSVHLARSRGVADRFSGDELPGAVQEDLDPTVMTGPLPVARPRERSLLRRPVTWLLVGAFAGQTTMYYGLSTWLPTIAADELSLDRATSGAIASLYQGCAIAGALLVPLLTRFTPRVVPILVIAASWLVLTIGLLVAPELLWVWLSIGAIGHAGGFVVIFTALVGVARDAGEAGALSALVQGIGYAVGALGAPALGALHEATGGWTIPLTAIMVLSIAYCVVLFAAIATSWRVAR
ncbi:CynX/NimT family MFS transporter [Microbacterium sp. RU33B]|uniref:MFS transporter n=1 Tax=Microbacterium sp. RU33B TaxID=1907390 RepID=UPI00096965D3|nr:MFS transporter [Microbacterium sp. RU33B]SIT76560.1 MFS transporter, CP family, cyanate transporter [Microbacterium sp. RU33B]